ncbi:MAG: phosphatidylethanolamine N-methyltransferase, partial [Dechloromonas agitata]|nr:phosphatidylethanolamine N-methyltransferase [Dechloromonas agitata]
MSLKHTYTLIAPFYDAMLARATRAARQRSLTALPTEPGRVLLAGVGTGLDLPHLPAQHHYIGLDLTHAM